MEKYLKEFGIDVRTANTEFRFLVGVSAFHFSAEDAMMLKLKGVTIDSILIALDDIVHLSYPARLKSSLRYFAYEDAMEIMGKYK